MTSFLIGNLFVYKTHIPSLLYQVTLRVVSLPILPFINHITLLLERVFGHHSVDGINWECTLDRGKQVSTHIVVEFGTVVPLRQTQVAVYMTSKSSCLRFCSRPGTVPRVRWWWRVFWCGKLDSGRTLNSQFFFLLTPFLRQRVKTSVSLTFC